MRMQRGICIDLDGDRSVYMLADGRFVTGRPQVGTVVGEEACFETFSTAPIKRRRVKVVFAMPVIAAIAVLILAISTFMMPEQEAYGYVQVESNPGIELGLDNDWHVISLRELNEDGRQLIGQLDAWENGSLEDVLKNVLALSINDETEHVTITTVQEQGETKTNSTVEQITRAALTANSDRTLYIHLKEANKEQWRQAKKQQIPVGQFAENNRTLTSPTNENNEVQPVQVEEKEIEKANSDGQNDQPGPAEKENPDVQSPASPSDDAGKSQPVPAEKLKPASLKDNSSAPAKPKSSTDKKENPADNKVDEHKPANQQSNNNKVNEKLNKAKQTNSGGKDPNEKSNSQENNNKQPQNNAPTKASSNSEQPGNGQGAQKKNNSPSSATDGKANAPNPEKKAGKDDQ